MRFFHVSCVRFVHRAFFVSFVSSVRSFRLRLVRIVNLYDPGSVLVVNSNLCSFLIYDVSANLIRNDGFRIFAA